VISANAIAGMYMHVSQRVEVPLPCSFMSAKWSFHMDMEPTKALEGGVMKRVPSAST
jgi:hypothetical protein